jgi:hypothetical protein
MVRICAEAESANTETATAQRKWIENSHIAGSDSQLTPNRRCTHRRLLLPKCWLLVTEPFEAFGSGGITSLELRVS